MSRPLLWLAGFWLAALTIVVLVLTLANPPACSPGPKPSGWTAQQYQSYVATACTGN